MPNKSRAEKIGGLLTLAAVVGLVLRWSDAATFFTRPQPFELLMPLAAVFTLWHIIAHNKRGLSAGLAFWTSFFAVFFLLLLAGFIQNIQLYGTNIATVMATAQDFYLFGGAALGFLLMFYYGKDQSFRKKILYSFFAVMIFVPLALIPPIREFITSNDTLIGFHKNPNVFAAFAFTGLACLFAFFTKEKRIVGKIIYWVSAVAVLTLILWTQSRASLLAVVAAAVFVASSEAAGREKKQAVKFLALSALIFFATFIISFSLLPHQTKVQNIARIFPQILGQSQDISFIGIVGAINTILENPTLSAPGQSRQEIWPLAVKLFIQHPLGLGPDYWRNSDVIKQYGTTTKAHNNVLEAALAGGVGGLVLFLLLIIATTKAIIYSSNRNREWLALSAVFIGLFIITFFNGAMQAFPWFWLVGGLVLAREQKGQQIDGEV